MRLSRVGGIESKFWGRVEKLGPEDCWNWIGSKTNWGYGRIGGLLYGERIAPKGSTSLAHRVSWILANGPIPSDGPGHHGWVVMHKCDNRLCVNPAHLTLGTQAANVKDMDEKVRGNRAGLTPRSGVDHPRFRLTSEQVAEVLASVEPAHKLAEKFSVSSSCIQRLRAKNVSKADLAALNGDIRKRGAPKGEAMHNARLTDSQVMEIRASSKTNEVLASELGVSETTIAYAKKRKTYRHLP